jgi:hypothetical protein
MYADDIPVRHLEWRWKGDCPPSNTRRKFITDANEDNRLPTRLLRAIAANKYCEKNADPSLAVPNEAAKGRDASWVEGEVRRLIKMAWREGFHGLAAAMAVAWDTQMSPVDVRSLRVKQFTPRPGGGAFFHEISGSRHWNYPEEDWQARWLLRWPTLKIMSAYATVTDGQYADPDGSIFRNRSGGEYTKDTLGEDFAFIRAKAFGPDEKRTLADFRRSGAIEAIAGGAKPAELSHTMANSLSASNALFAIYCPANVVSLDATAAARRGGRKRIAEAMRVPNANGTKV